MSTNLHQSEGGFTIDTALHRCTVLPAPQDLRAEQEAEDAAIERFHAACDKVIATLFALVLVFALLDRYAHILPGGGL